jgi:hypothetical protein
VRGLLGISVFLICSQPRPRRAVQPAEAILAANSSKARRAWERPKAFIGYQAEQEALMEPGCRSATCAGYPPDVNLQLSKLISECLQEGQGDEWSTVSL